MPRPAMAPALEALLPALWAPWGLPPLAAHQVLTEQNGRHLRLRLTDAEGHAWLLRECPDHMPPAEWAFHAALLARHADAAPPEVPRARLSRHADATARVADRSFALQSWMPGHAHQRLDATDPVAAAAALGRVDRWLAGLPLHALPPRPTAYCADISSPITSLSSPQAECDVGGRSAYWLRRLPPGRRCAAHGDPHPYNFLWLQRRPSALIDWDDAHVNSPAWDLAYFLTHLTFIHWPSHSPGGSDKQAWVRDAPDLTRTDALVRAYRDGRGAPWATDSGWRYALIRAFAMTVRLTVFGRGVDDADRARAVRMLDWIAQAEEVAAWQSLLSR